MMVLRSCPLALLMSGLLTMVTGDTPRTAKDMALNFYRTILYSSVSDEASAIAEADWRSYAEWDWGRSEFHETNETKKYPFIVCDDIQGETNVAVNARQKILQDALNLAEIANVNLMEYLYPVVNSEETICVVGSYFSSVAANLDFVVQPISFLMKINSATTDFSGLDYEENVELEYFVVGCPGLDEEYGEEWWKNAMRQFVPWLGYLVENGALPGQEKLLQFKVYLESDPNYCDSTMENDVKVELTDAGYAKVSLTTETLTSRSCFQIFAYAMAAAPEICYIERIVPTVADNKDAQWTSQSNRMCEVPFHDSGLTGNNQIVSLSDSGIDLNSCYFRDSKPMTFGSIDLSRRKVVQYVAYADKIDDIKGHGTHVAGTIAGHKSLDGNQGLDGFANGVAPDAKLAFVDLIDTASGVMMMPAEMSDVLDHGKNAGARIHSASWGAALVKEYSVRERDLDKYLNLDDDFLMIVAAGNSGPSVRTIGSPAKAKNVLTVGATGLDDRLDHQVAAFSSRGPTMDGRIKPDIVAHGTDVLSAGAEEKASCDPAEKPRSKRPVSGLMFKEGTSMATPVVSGTAALVRQYFDEGWQGDGNKGSGPSIDISGTLLKAILINGARPLVGYAINEVDSKQGFGRLSLIDSISLSGKNDLTGKFLDKQEIMEGEVVFHNNLSNFNSSCESGGYEFSVTLVWTDTAGPVGCKQCLMNDLDLKAVQTSTTETVTTHFPNGLVNNKDSVNNVERIRFVANPGDSIRVTVKAAKLDGNSKSYALAAVSTCDGFISSLATKPAIVCNSLYSHSGADHFQSWWMTSLVFVWFPLLIVMR